MNVPVKHIPRKKWNTASHDQIDAYKSLLDDKLVVCYNRHIE